MTDRRDQASTSGGVRGCGFWHIGDCKAEQEQEGYGFGCPVTERDGLRLGDKVMLNGRWPAEIIGFNSLPEDVAVRWTGLRPLSALGGDSTIDRRFTTVVKVLPSDDTSAS